MLMLYCTVLRRAVPCCVVQSLDVVVYRLVTCGTVEEKIYRKQVRLVCLL